MVGFCPEWIGQEHFFAKSENKAFCAEGKSLAGDCALHQLSGNIMAADNGPGNELGKHGDVEAAVEYLLFGRDKTSVDVNKI